LIFEAAVKSVNVGSGSDPAKKMTWEVLEQKVKWEFQAKKVHRD